MLETCESQVTGCGVWGSAVSCGSGGCADATHCALGADKVTVEQWGSTSFDGVYAVSTDSANEPLVAAAVSATFDGQPYSGDADAFVGARSASSGAVWTRMNGTPSDDSAVGVAAGSNGEVFESGCTDGKIGSAQLGGTDAFVIARAADHSVKWITQWGTSATDNARGMARDASGNLWVVGETWGALHGTNAGDSDAFVSKLDASGNVRWSVQWGTANADVALRVITDAAGNAYVVGLKVVVPASPQQRDVVLVKLDAGGNIKWNTKWNSPADAVGRDVILLSSGKLLVVGSASGAMGGTGTGASFVSTVSATGSVESTEQFGSNYTGGAFAAAKGTGTDVYIAGTLDGSSVSGALAGTEDGYVQKRDEAGTVSWTKQFGTLDDERVESMALSADGVLYIGGYTYGSFPGYINAGMWDAFVATVKP